MSEQSELVYGILEALNREGILQDVIVVGSWCIYFYRHHYKESEILPPLRTRDIEFDVSLLVRSPQKVDIMSLLERFGFVVDFKGSGFTNFVSPELIVEFLVPEKSRGSSEPYVMPGFGINAQPIRYLSLLEEKLITVSYRGLAIKVPHPAWFAIHKLIISRRRPEKQASKKENDLIQALAVWDMLITMKEEERIREVVGSIPRGWRKLMEQALGKAQQLGRLERLKLGRITRMS